MSIEPVKEVADLLEELRAGDAKRARLAVDDYSIGDALASCREGMARLRATLSPRSYELRSATLALQLLRQCVATWTALVSVWTIDVIARCVLGYSPATDWAFVADCAIDVPRF